MPVSPEESFVSFVFLPPEPGVELDYRPETLDFRQGKEINE